MHVERVIDYRSPVAATSVSRAATRVVVVVTLLIPVSFVVFVLLHRHQRSLPDPYSPTHTNWRAWRLLAMVALAFVDFVLLVVLRRRIAPAARYFGWLAVLASGAYIAWFLIGLLRFLYPGVFASTAGA